jgi:hypothetical protein
LNLKDQFDGDRFPGILGVNCASELLPLTSVRGTLNTRIDALTAANSTYVPDGVMWGMRLLTNAAPFEDGLPFPSTFDLRKALIVMTDGQNTIQPLVNGVAANVSFNRISHVNSPTSGSGMSTTTISTVPDNLTLQACTNAKAAGIEVYTIGFGSSITNSIRDLLKKCASKTEMYFDAADSSGLSIAFGKISNKLLAVRLVQ